MAISRRRRCLNLVEREKVFVQIERLIENKVHFEDQPHLAAHLTELCGFEVTVSMVGRLLDPKVWEVRGYSLNGLLKRKSVGRGAGARLNRLEEKVEQMAKHIEFLMAQKEAQKELDL